MSQLQKIHSSVREADNSAFSEVVSVSLRRQRRCSEILQSPQIIFFWFWILLSALLSGCVTQNERGFTPKEVPLSDVDKVHLASLREHFRSHPERTDPVTYFINAREPVTAFLASDYPPHHFISGKANTWVPSLRKRIAITLEVEFSKNQSACEVWINETIGIVGAVSWKFTMILDGSGKWVVVRKKLGSLA